MTHCEKMQKTQLRHILDVNESTRLASHLGLNSIDPQTNFPDLYKAFKQHAPMQTYEGFMAQARQLVHTNNIEHDVQVLGRPGLIAAKPPEHFGRGRQGFFPPLNQETLGFIQKFDNGLHFCADKLGLSLGGKILYLLDSAHFDEQNGFSIGDIRAAQLRHTSTKIKKHSLPDLAEVAIAGKSHHQAMHVFADILEREGHSIQAIVGEPRRLTELSLLLAQRNGRFVDMAELCPHLKIFVQDGGDYDPYQQEFAHIFKGLDIKRLVAYTSGMGAFGFTADPSHPTDLLLQVDGGTFFEFVPVAHVRSDGTVGMNAERFWLQNVTPGQDYMLMVTTTTGFTAVSTGDIVRVLNTEPLKIRFIRRSFYLNHFGERLTTPLINPLINTFNQALAAHNLFIRDYMVGDHLADKKQYWALELSRPATAVPLQALQSMANRLHRELLQNHIPYRQAFHEKRFNLPEIIVLPMGTFCALPDSFRFTYIDRSDDARLVLAIAQHTGSAAVRVRASVV